MSSVTALPANLPDISTARLPVAYEAAAKAIAECHRIDECKGWSDRAAALASYARQAKNDSLRVMAVRIQARAIRRCGELVEQIEPSKGGQPTHDGAGISRTKAAEQAGLSERQKVTALRVASIPSEAFDQQIESNNPPTITALADQGRQVRAVDRKPDFERFKAACSALHAFVKFCDANEAAATAEAFEAADIAMARKCVTTLDQWLDRFVAHLPA